MKRQIARLIFVYDAASGKLAALADSLKKLVGKGCPLCAMTHGLNGVRPEWRQFESSLGVPVSYVHSDEAQSLIESHPGLKLPCVIAELEAGEQVVLLDAEAIERCRGTDSDLRGRLSFRIATLDLELPAH